jgi:cytochrome P450
VAFVVYDPELLASLREEVEPALSDGQIDYRYLTEKCPQLEAAINELLRVVSEGTLAREVISPTIIGGKMLQTGRKVIVSTISDSRKGQMWPRQQQDPQQQVPNVSPEL